MAKTLALALLFFGLSVFCMPVLHAQTTEFAYQGSLKDGVSAANGNYDFEFALFDALSGGAQLGSTLTRGSVAVANGIFSVQLDFGSQFPGANRFLEIRLRPTGDPGGYQQLLPRQAINSAPYSVRSLNSTAADSATTASNALQLGGVAANQFVVTTDPRMSDSRAPTAGSANYIQNQTAVFQASNFKIGGDGSAAGTLSGTLVNATTEFRIGGNRILSNQGTGNMFAGVGAGTSNVGGLGNSFFGNLAGQSNGIGINNSFFGSGAGQSNTSGGNSFFGALAGTAVTTGHDNSFVGNQAGKLSTTGSDNSFVGAYAGILNTTGGANSFFGISAGGSNTSGSANLFLGRSSGSTNTIGDNNTIVGYNADVGSNNLNYATAIGSDSVASLSNSIYLGRADGSDTVRVPGNLNVTGNTSLNGNLTFASGGIASINGANFFMTQLPAGAGMTLCHTASNQVVTCSSSLRYKTNIKRFGFGLDLIDRLKPITFDWKEGGTHDFGLGAEDVAAIEPLLVTYNDKGEVEGVKYDRIGVVLVNAVKEQQAEISDQRSVIGGEQRKIEELNIKIENQQSQIEAQQKQLDELKQIVCSLKPDAGVCRQQ